MSDEIEFDASYFGSRRKGIVGRDAAGLVQVFGLLERNDYGHAKIIPNATAAMLVPVLREKVCPTVSTMPIHSGHMICSKNARCFLNWSSNNPNKLSLRLKGSPIKSSS